MKKKLADDFIYTYGHARSMMPMLLTRPLGYFFYITKRCNLNCSFCYQKAFASNSSEESLKASPLSPTQWRIITRKLPRYSFIGVSGGEATLSKALIPILEEAAQKKIPVTLNTNGTGFNDQLLETIRRSSIRNISISLDGFADVHDKHRGTQGLFQHIVHWILKLNEVRKTTPISLTIKTVILDENMPQLQRFRAFCSTHLKADTLNLSFAKTGDHAQFALQHHPNLKYVLSQKHAAIPPYMQQAQLPSVLAQLIRANRSHHCQVTLYPQMNTEKQIRRFLDKAGINVYKPCYLPWAQIVVLPDGSIIPCLSVWLGNLIEWDLDIQKLLKTLPYADFLKKVAAFKAHLPRACTGCCFLKVIH